MHTIGVLLLAAATAGDGFGYSKPGVGFKKLLRHHVVVNGPAPPGGPIAAGATGAACPFGHPGCAGGTSCPGPGGPGGPGGVGPSAGRRFPNIRSQIFFLDPDGMKVGWQTGAGVGQRVYLPAQLTVPARYNFLQGYIYRLKLTDIPGRPGVSLYPTIEVAPSTPATDAYLTHNPIPVQFTAEDFDQVVDGGNFVTKVIYLPDPKYQELAIAGVETLVSTRLEPGVDPILEADKRGTILLIVRLGAIDLEMPNGAPGAVVLPPTSPAAGAMTPPATLPLESAPADTAPVTPAPTTAPAPAPGTPPTPMPSPALGTPPAPAPNTPPPPTAPDPETPTAPPAEAPKP